MKKLLGLFLCACVAAVLATGGPIGCTKDTKDAKKTAKTDATTTDKTDKTDKTERAAAHAGVDEKAPP